MTSTDNGVIAAYLLDGRGHGQPLSWPQVEQWREADGLLWLHMEYQHPHVTAWLEQQSGLEPLVVQALLAEETRPRTSHFTDGQLVTLRGINGNPGADPEDMVAVRIFLQSRRIITTRRRRLLTAATIEAALVAGHGPTSPGDFLATFAASMMARVGEVIEEVEERIDTLEEEMLSGQPRELRHQLSELRRDAILLRRYLAPQREAMIRLATDSSLLYSDAERMRLREVADSVSRQVEELDSARERATVVHEELLGRLSDQLNQRTYILSIVAAIFLPLGFLTGLLGINVGGIPGSDYPYAFLLVSGGLLGVVALQLLLFRRRGWF